MDCVYLRERRKEKYNQKKNNTRYQSWRDMKFVATSGTKRRKYTPGLKNSRTSLFLSSYLDRLLSVRYRESHFLKRICNERAREVCPRSAGNIHFLTHLYIFSRRESKTKISRRRRLLIRKEWQNKKKTTNEKQHFTPEDLFPFYYPSNTQKRRNLVYIA